MSAPDLVWLDDMDAYASETTSEEQNLEQDVLHMLAEDLGSNLDAPEQGAGVANILGAPTSEFEVMIRTIEAALRLDDRVDSSTVALTQLPSGGYNLDVTVQVAGDVLDLGFTLAPDGSVSTQ